MDNSEISKNAIKFVRENKEYILNKFASKERYKTFKKPVSFFMAGSPGAGKTEFSKVMIKLLEKEISKSLKIDNFFIVRIDADDVRKMLPGYTGSNSSLFQEACVLAVNKIHDYALHNGMNILMDGTLASYKYAKENIERSLKRKREVYISYIYQDPMNAWEFTKARENKEGRNITLEVFIESLFKAKDNVNKMKQEFGKSVVVDLIIKDYNSAAIKKYHIDIHSIDSHLKFDYTKESLYKKLEGLK